VNQVEVHIVGLQAGQALVDAAENARRVDAFVDFCRQEHVLAAAPLEPATDDLLGEASAVHGGRVDETGALLHCGGQNAMGLGFVTPVAEHHAAQAHLGYMLARASKRYGIHQSRLLELGALLQVRLDSRFETRNSAVRILMREHRFDHVDGQGYVMRPGIQHLRDLVD